VREADVVLNPHRASAFGFARSGTFSEAMASAKPVIAAKGTFMAQEIAHYDTGLVFEDGSSESLSQMIRCAVDQFTFLQKKSKAAQGKWLNIHNAQNFTDIFLQNIQSDF
jgi:glycosyltransferase involved in cell wall biosynthesis